MRIGYSLCARNIWTSSEKKCNYRINLFAHNAAHNVSPHGRPLCVSWSLFDVGKHTRHTDGLMAKASFKAHIYTDKALDCRKHIYIRENSIYILFAMLWVWVWPRVVLRRGHFAKSIRKFRFPHLPVPILIPYHWRALDGVVAAVNVEIKSHSIVLAGTICS